MSDRIAEIRARLDEWGYMSLKRQATDGAEYADDFAADIAWLLDEVERLRRYTHHAHNDCWQSGKCVCGLGGAANV